MTTPAIAGSPRISGAALRALRSTTGRPFSPRPLQSPPRTRRSTTTFSCSKPQLPTAASPDLISRPYSNRRPLHTTTPTRRQQQQQQQQQEEVRKKTNLGDLDVLASAPVPSTAVEGCHADGFSLNSGVQIEGGAGALLVSGKAFCWKPWLADAGGVEGGKGVRRLVNEKGQWDVGEEGFALLSLVWPRPDLLILGLGPSIRPLSPATRRAISNLGMRVEVLDTRNAASQYNLLATERGVEDVAAALIPIGWKE